MGTEITGKETEAMLNESGKAFERALSTPEHTHGGVGHKLGCGWTSNSPHCLCGSPATETVPVTRAEFEIMATQIAELHEIFTGLATVLNNPMIKAMLPAEMRM